ncbi:hypothetical protein BaRGS_00007033 [Batillaria attramentaria]|uniref:Uncharacterized protein n=1 Tax=Batillaria attramentaria TaxID=370345 RepID=A0ABD0LQ79_9CAEN
MAIVRICSHTKIGSSGSTTNVSRSWELWLLPGGDVLMTLHWALSGTHSPPLLTVDCVRCSVRRRSSGYLSTRQQAGQCPVARHAATALYRFITAPEGHQD